MATTRFYLDTRYADSEQGMLKIALTHKGSTAYILLDIRLNMNQWDKRAEKVVNHPQKLLLNTYIYNKRNLADSVILRLMESGEIAGMKVSAIKRCIECELDPERKKKGVDESTFEYRFLRFAQSKRKDSTKECYMHTYGRMKVYCDYCCCSKKKNAKLLNELRFEDITKQWLMDFEKWLSISSPSQNARNIHLRNIRAVFNDAIDDEVTQAYPFRRMKIRPVPTIKRSLSVEQLRQLFSYQVEPNVVKYVDVFKLIFCLIGINVVDLCNLREVRDGRVEYYRSKTNRLYSIKVEPEALALIDKYRGKKQLLYMLDRYSNHKDYMRRLNENLRRVGRVTRSGRGGKKHYEPLFNGITSYWARHSWATVAASLDIPKETIAAALGHGGNTVTDIYIDFDRRKVDEANRRVLDWVFYGIS